MRGRQQISAHLNAHLFATPWGTVDELGRPIDKGNMVDLTPSWDVLRINHYICQSRQYYTQFKHASGFADAGHTMVRPDFWWDEHDRNEVQDDTILRYRAPLLAKITELQGLMDD